MKEPEEEREPRERDRGRRVSSDWLGKFSHGVAHGMTYFQEKEEEDTLRKVLVAAGHSLSILSPILPQST
jgi:hypothetical protein